MSEAISGSYFPACRPSPLRLRRANVSEAAEALAKAAALMRATVKLGPIDVADRTHSIAERARKAHAAVQRLAAMRIARILWPGGGKIDVTGCVGVRTCAFDVPVRSCRRNG